MSFDEIDIHSTAEFPVISDAIKHRNNFGVEHNM